MSFPSLLKVTHCWSLKQLTRRRIWFGVLASPLGVVGTHHERKPIEVDGLPWITPRQKLKPLFVACAVDHDGTSIPHVLGDDIPQAFTDPCRQRPDEYPRGDFHQPPSHVPT